MKRILALLLSAVLVVSFAGCKKTETNGIMKTTYAAQKDNDVIAGNILFAFDFFRKLNIEDREENIFISPLSISAALSMLYNGALGQTKLDMAEVLGYEGIDHEAFNSGQRYLLDRLGKLDPKVTVDISNSVWIREGFSVNPDFIRLSRNTFDAEVKDLDFNRPDAPQVINRWVEEKTRGKIDQILDQIANDVVMYLINTIYFLGDWTYRFDKDRTEDQVFHNYRGDTSTVDMMYLRSNLKYMENDRFQAVRLPYGDGKASMYILLPADGMDIHDLIDSLNPRQWEEIVLGMTVEENVTVRLPRFRMEYGIRNISNELIAMGMGSAFHSADFGNIAPNLEISRVLHKAVIEVDEEGTEAAAVTAVEIRKTSIIPGDQPKKLVADRPFLFFIADDEDQTILFMGKMLNHN